MRVFAISVFDNTGHLIHEYQSLVLFDHGLHDLNIGMSDFMIFRWVFTIVLIHVLVTVTHISQVPRNYWTRKLFSISLLYIICHFRGSIKLALFHGFKNDFLNNKRLFIFPLLLARSYQSTCLDFVCLSELSKLV